MLANRSSTALLFFALLGPWSTSLAQRPSTPTAAAQVQAVDTARDARLARADRGRIRGSTDAIWLIAISDFQCPFCKRWHEETLPLIERDYVRSGKVQIAYINYPISSSHPNAPAVHEFAMCAAEQGQFWRAADVLFRSQRSWGSRRDVRPFLDSIARGIALDQRRLASCLDSREMQALVDSDYNRAARLGVGSTPSFLIGGRALIGAQPYEAFQQAIDAALAEQASPRGSPTSPRRP